MTDKLSEQTYTLKLNGHGIAVDTAIDSLKARHILNLILSDTGDLQAPSRTPTASKGSERALSLREYLDQREATSKPNQIVAIANYLVEVEKLDDVGRDEIKSRFATAREPLPANFPRDFTTTLRNGWLAEVHGKPDRYYVTQSGTQALASNFKTPPRRTTSKRRTSAKDE